MKEIEDLLIKACSDLGLDRINVWAYDISEHKLNSVSSYQEDTQLFFEDVEILGIDYPKYFKAIQNYDYILSNDALNDPINKELLESYIKPLGIKSMLDIPYKDGKDELKYLLCLEHLKKHQFSEDEVNYAKKLIKNIAKILK